MKCPICDDMRMREVIKDGVTIDVCPNCKGVWLDRGELDKLMQGVNAMRQEWDEREFQGMPAPNPGSVPIQPMQQPAQPAPGYGQQPPAGYGTPQQPVYGSHPQGQGYYGNVPPQGGYGQKSGGYGYDKYGTKHGYDKYGRPYKKKKTVLDVFGDLFD